MSPAEKWRNVRRMVVRTLSITSLCVAGVSFWLDGPTGAAVTILSVLCLALGLWITELLIAVFTGMRKANPTAMALLMLGKVLWWGSLILGAKLLPAGFEKSVALGIGAFLLAVVITGIAHYGMPKISDVQE